MKNIHLHHGDCLEVLKTLPDCSVDSIVTDPPYGLTTNKKGGSGTASVNLENPYGRARIGTGNGAGGFMGMKWDSDVPPVEVWAECLRVLKPGGHLLAFFGTRTYHRGVTRIEDAGFEIRDQIGWAFGSGFPKSHNGPWGGTALKPAWEPIVLARKALIGTVEANWQEHGTGALNIDGCRVAGEPWKAHSATGLGSVKFFSEGDTPVIDKAPHDAGRWPANLIHDGSDEVLVAFPQAKGQQGALTGSEPSSKTANAFGEFAGRAPSAPRGDTGSAARFFYCAKASKRDRDEGLDGFSLAKTNDGRKVDADNAYQRGATLRANTHPTVKPTDLMRYLLRLVTPPGGVALDPYMGSGSTGKAAVLEGFGFIGIEREAEYIAIAQARIDAASRRGLLL